MLTAGETLRLGGGDSNYTPGWSTAQASPGKSKFMNTIIYSNLKMTECIVSKLIKAPINMKGILHNLKKHNRNA
jgi:hypothetical protein